MPYVTVGRLNKRLLAEYRRPWLSEELRGKGSWKRGTWGFGPGRSVHPSVSWRRQVVALLVHSVAVRGS